MLKSYKFVILAAVAAMLGGAQVQLKAQQTLPYWQDFTNVTGASGGVWCNTCDITQLTNRGFALYTNGTGSYRPHIVNNSSNTGVYYKYSSNSQNQRSLCMAAQSNTNYGSTQHVVLPVMAKPVKNLIFKCWIATSSNSLGTLSVGYVTDDNGTGSFVSVQDFTANDASYCATPGAQTTGGRDIEVDLSSVPSTATRIALRWYNNSSTAVSCCVDDINVIENPNITCFAVSSLAASSITTTSATLTWSEEGESTQWQVRLDGGASQTVSSTTYALTGLTANTAYTAEVRAVCDASADEYSDWTPVAFRTLCNPISTLPYTETFESYYTGVGEEIDPCWHTATVGSTTTYVYPNTRGTGSSSKSLFMQAGTSYYSLAVLPQLSVPLSQLMIEFDLKRDATLSNLSNVQVGIITNPSDISTFTPLRSINLTGAAANAESHYRFSLASLTGTGRLAFYVPTATSTSCIDIDNVTVDYLPACPWIEDFAIQSLTEGTLTVTWSGSASQYEAQLATASDFTAGVTTNTVSVTRATFSGLETGQYYYVRVRAKCGSDYGEWSDALEAYATDFSAAGATGLYAATGTVVLNDLEPHDWSIYTNDVDAPMRSLNPLDVKITYRGYGTNNMVPNPAGWAAGTATWATWDESRDAANSASDYTLSTTAEDVSVGVSAQERQYHAFEYYKTLDRLDKVAGTGRAEYRTIFNPFSRRPAVNPESFTWEQVIDHANGGAPCFRGFAWWRVDAIQGGSVYTVPTGGTPLQVGDLVKADQKLYFEGTTGVEIEFTAMWARAMVRYMSYTGSDMNNPGTQVGINQLNDSWGASSLKANYDMMERNFLVVDQQTFLTTNTNSIARVMLEQGGNVNGAYSSLFPNGTYDGVEEADGPVTANKTTARDVVRHATKIELCPGEGLDDNRVIFAQSNVRIEYMAIGRLYGVKKGFHLDGSHATLWGTYNARGNNFTLGRGIVEAEGSKGTFNYIWGAGPQFSGAYNSYSIGSGNAVWACKRNSDNDPLNHSGTVLTRGVSYHYPSAGNYYSNDLNYTIRLESGYVGCVMTLYGWNYQYQTVDGANLNSTGETATPTLRANGQYNNFRFIYGNDFDRADELQRVQALGTDYASKQGPNGQPYETLDSMLYHELYKNAKLKMYRPFRVSSFNMQINYQHKDSVYSDVTIKSGFIGQESIDRQKWGHGDGATGQAGDPRGTVVVDGISRGGWMVHSIYNVASNNNAHRGKRRMRIEGGFINSSVSLGAWDRTNDVTRWYSNAGNHRWATASEQQSSMPNDVSTLRMTGGHITGSVFGGGNTYTASGGGRQIIITGGTVRAWIAGGVNGSDARPDQWEGIHFGNAWIYAGGTLHVGSGDTTHRTVGDTVWHAAYCGINGTTDGQIFGAGCGLKPYYFRADSVEIDHQWNMNAWKHHRGGRVDSSFVYIADQAEVEGDVYGGGNFGYNNTEDGDDYHSRWQSGSQGDPDYPAKGKATLRILGGTVGGNVFGGANRKMGPEVDILMKGGHVKRGIFGGSNTWGYIKKDVTINLLGGTVGTDERPGMVCGGGLGKETAVFGNITLNIGAAGTPGPVIYGDVYGGSQNGTTNAGSTTKTAIGSFNLDPNHGAGGEYDFYNVAIDTADAQGYGYNTSKKTIINMRSGRIDGNLFGGGYGPGGTAASTYGDITVNFLGGEVMENIYGCNNASGKPMGKVKVNIGTPDSVAASVADGDRSHRNRPVVHGSVFGGGNDAPYGTAHDNYTPVVEMFSGTVGRNVFGGGQGGTAEITLPDETHATKVLIRNGSVQGNVYGGGNDARVIGNTRVVIGHDGTLFTLTVASANPAQGTATGGGTYSQDEDVVLTATPASGYSFKQWSDGNTDNPRTVTVTGNQTYTAEFETTPQYNIDVTANEPSWGTFSGAGSYDVGSRVQIKATPNTGVRFTQWSDGVTYNPRTVTVTADATYTAQFESVPQWTLTVQPNNASWGTASGGGTFYEGVITSISASANDGYLFRRWSDGETYNPRTLSLSSNLTLTAIFEAIPTWTLALQVSPTGAGTVDGAGTYLETATATFSTAPNTGYRFLRWSDGSTNLSRSIRLTQDTSLTAIYEAIPTYVITANVATGQSARGTVTGGGTYYENTTATLRAQANEGYRFKRWTDDVTDNPRTVTVTSNATFTAEFEEFHIYWVDLGLPSGKLWAEVNVGATSEEERGDYFAWGETAPKTNYNWSTYAYSNGSQYTLTKYNSSSSYGTVDNKTTLEATDDAATVNFGASAYMPSEADWNELVNNSTITLATRNGVKGQLFVGTNGNSIFLPANGFYNSTSRQYATSYGYYWSSTRYTTSYQAKRWYFSATDQSTRAVGNMNRFIGMGVRAVRNASSCAAQYTVTANVATGQSAMGSVSGGGSYCQYQKTTLRATANAGYMFKRWSDGETTNPRTVYVTGNATYTAEFEEFVITWVDMGLPSGTLWASVNVGATNMEDYGDYYAWGELTTKTNYSWSTYAHGNSTSNITKYNASDGLATLQPVDDIATLTYGSGAAIPTATEWLELNNYTNFTTVTQNGVSGALLTSTVNGRTLFFPYAGYKVNSTIISNNTASCLWTSTRGSSVANGRHTYINSNTSRQVSTGVERYQGFNIRAVKPAGMKQITATAANAAHGSVVGGGSYRVGAQAQLRATGNAGYAFQQWNDGSTSNPRTVTVTDDATYTATFQTAPTYPLTAVPGDAAWGSVTGGGNYTSGTTVTLTATPASGYIFVCWQDGNTSATRNVFTTTNNATYTAYFTPSTMQWVDLGLPSGRLWGTINVGATTPYGAGGYYCWGGIAPQSNYSDASARFYSSSGWTKYNASDGLTTLQPADDIAYLTYGTGAHTPTMADFQELCASSASKRTVTVGDRSCVVFIGSNGRCIILPGCGYYGGSASGSPGSNYYYWTSTLSTDKGKGVDAMPTNDNCLYNGTTGERRGYGFNIRAVKNP